MSTLIEKDPTMTKPYFLSTLSFNLIVFDFFYSYFFTASQMDYVKTQYLFLYLFLTKCQIPDKLSERGCEIDFKATQREPKGVSEGTSS